MKLDEKVFKLIKYLINFHELESCENWDKKLKADLMNFAALIGYFKLHRADFCKQLEPIDINGN